MHAVQADVLGMRRNTGRRSEHALMPSKTKSQRKLMRAALHGADFPKARKVRRSMSRDDLKHFAKGPISTSNREVYAYDFRSRNNLKRGRG
jgi:hypothetical protein